MIVTFPRDQWNNPSGADIHERLGINKVNTMGVIALAPHEAKPSRAMAMTMQN